MILRIIMVGLFGVMMGASALAQDGRELFVDVPSSSLTSEVMSRATKMGADPSAASTRMIRVELSLLADPTKPITISVAGMKLSATGVIEERSGNKYVWTGKIAGDPLSSVILVVRGERVTGDVRTSAGLFRVAPIEGGMHVLTKINEGGLRPDHAPSPPPGKKTNFRSIESAPSIAIAPTAPPPPRLHTLNVLAAYTAKAKENVEHIEDVIDLAEQQANLSYQNSLVSIRLKIAKYKTTYVESGDADVDMQMKEVLAKRKEYGADIAVLLVWDLFAMRDGERHSLCGRALDIGADYGSAFVVMDASCLADNLTMPHEIGHLLGARHNWEKDDSRTPCVYGHGIYSIAGRWRTVMSYDCDPPGGGVCNRKLYWSNPRIKYENGAPMGDPDYADDARCLNERVQVFCTGTAPCSIAPSLIGDRR